MALVLFLALLPVVLPNRLLAAEVAEPTRVLLINSLGREFAPWDAFAGDFRTELQRRHSPAPDIYEVSLESARVHESQEEPVVKYIQSLFDGRTLDLVVPIGGPAVRFAQRHRSELFPEVPMLMTAVEHRHIQPASLTSNDAVVAVLVEPHVVIENILHVLPGTTNIIVVIGNSPLERFWLETFRREFQPFSSRVAFEWWHELSFPEMLRRSAALPPKTAIFYSMLMVDAAGNSFSQQRALSDLRANATAPLFGLHSTQLGHGIVGGRLTSISRLSRNSAEVAERILRGEAPSGIQTPVQAAEKPVFDYRELRRWQIREAILPPGSTVQFRQPTMWQQYQSRIIGIVAVVLVQAVVISVLLANLAKRRRAERSLAESEARFQVAAEAAPVMIWLAGTDKLCTFFNKAWLRFTGRPLAQELGDGWAEGVHPEDLAVCMETYSESFNARRAFAMEYRLRNKDGEYAWVLDTGSPRFAADGTFAGYVGSATDITAVKQAEELWRTVVESAAYAMVVVDTEGKITLVNARVEAVFGYDRFELIGQSIEKLVPESLLPHFAGFCEQYRINPAARLIQRSGEIFGRCKDGSQVPVEIGLNPIRTQEGRFVLVSVVDITERMAALANLRESEKRMTLAADAANLGMWVWDVPSINIWATARCKEIYGYPPEEELLFDALFDRVHAEDRDAVDNAIAEAFNENGAFHLEHRLRLPDGVVRWMSTSGRVEQSANNGPLRLMGISINITERKSIEEAAREVSGKLITAQEDERRRIARDLHDDLNQRLAMLSVQVDLLDHMEIPQAAHAIITEVASNVHDLSSEVHKLSYQLHPAKLDQLGLVAAVRSYCQEVSRHCRLPVKFTHEEVPPDLPSLVALSLYRIIQESLQNVIKHSGASSAGVELRRVESRIELKVTDNGHGFETGGLTRQTGLGLLGMRERVRLMHGQIVFHSSRHTGTEIEVTVPLTTAQPVTG